jgi:nitroimidazol reductase NimA-like FMN-containing flavoprotein (pyridoxamine 5'-phosphate oxidase superfamily)
MADVAPSPRTRVRRHPERGAYDAETVHAILDEALLCHLAWVTDEGHPRVIPTIHVRTGGTLYVHGSAASNTLRGIRDGRTICIEVTLLDGLVLSRSTPNHSMNYRSVIVYGEPREVTEAAERNAAQLALVEHVIPGRTAEVRMPTDKEMKETSIFAVALTDASAKIRTGPPLDPEEDLTSPAWAGVVPVALAFGRPESSPDLAPGIDVPPTVTGYARPGASDDRGATV